MNLKSIAITDQKIEGIAVNWYRSRDALILMCLVVFEGKNLVSCEGRRSEETRREGELTFI